MITRVVELPRGWEADRLEAWLSSQPNVEVGPRRALRTIRDSSHWHLRAPALGSGIVECTLDPTGQSVTFAVHDNRRGTWAMAAAEALGQKLRRAT